MIISHKHKFIFLKTRKTAGTSIEIALRQFCGPDDIITRISPVDEKTSQELGGRGPQNYEAPFRHYRLSDWYLLLTRRSRRVFSGHMPSRHVSQYAGRTVWNDYYKFCFERNPFDKAVSRYYWSTRKSDPRPSIDEYLASAPERLLSNWDVYTIDDQVAVDFIGRFENLKEDLATISKKIGLPGELVLPRAKGGHRKDKRHYSEVLSPESRAVIERVCARELDVLGYSW